jgi:hypothetical protein
VTRLAAALAVIAVFVLPVGTAAQSSRVDLTGPFIHLGGVVGSVTGTTAAPGDSHTGGGWSAGGGITLGRWTALVGNYAIFNFRDDGAPTSGTMEQAEVGLRVRVGGKSTPAIFYVEGGGALRRAALTTTRLFPDEAPPDAGATVDTDGWAGWFGPGVQFYFSRRLAAEVSVAWAWGSMDTAHINGTTLAAGRPIDLTTLRLRAGFAATLF